MLFVMVIPKFDFSLFVVFFGKDWGQNVRLKSGRSGGAKEANQSALAVACPYIPAYYILSCLLLFFASLQRGVLVDKMQSVFPLDNMQPSRERSTSLPTAGESRAAEPPSGAHQAEENHRLLDPHIQSALQKGPIHTTHPSRLNDGRSSAFHAWWQELVLSAYALSLFIAITAILSCFNKRTQPSWTFGLNLNTLIALLATFLRSGLGMIVEQGT